MSDDVPRVVKPYLDEIADRLWSDSAAVMVGAGFSQNAQPVGSVSASFPSWQKLGDDFYTKLYGKPPGKESRYLSLLRLAEQFQAAFGRPALDRMLLRAIPDLLFEPSRLHSRLLSLPWEDVFTTNYDTLLERACASVTLKRYQVVTTKDDLLQATGRRIVKLHGSFPSPPFVITEEDYRRYPNEHAPFVNTVRQALLEKTLCLIGFSGDDPNFLQWVGWLRDQVGRETAPSIYLLVVFGTMSEADKKLLNRRGIVPVDLSGFSTDPRTALGCFLAYLEGRKTRALAWPGISSDADPWVAASSSGPGKFREVAAEWRGQRNSYPGWVVMPEDRRRTLWLDTPYWLSRVSQMSPEDRDLLESPVDLDLAFELIWRLERCLFPLTGELPALLEAVVAKYDNGTVRIPEDSHWSKPGVNEAIASIRLCLLRHYREQGLEEKWENVRQAISGRVERLLPEHRARLRLEEALQALYRFDPGEAKRLLVEWQSNDNLPFWEAKRAATMAELGETTAARSILESSLSAIRRQQSLSPVRGDYTLVSQESVVMLLLWAVERAMSVSEPGSGDSSLLDELSDRWNELARYKCDPRREIDLFSARLQHRPVARCKESTSHEFDLGMVSKTAHFGFDEEIAAYGLLRLYEDIGMPFRMENITFVSKQVKATLPRVGPYSPHWALANVVRLGDAEAADWVFNREYLAGLGEHDADLYFDVYLSALERTLTAIDGSDLSEVKTFETLARTLPEVFSRLCYKCSAASRARLLAALRGIYGATRRQALAKVGNLVRRLIDSMSVEERVRAVPLLIDFPVPDQLGATEREGDVNPLLLVSLPAGVRGEALDVPQDKVERLLERFADQGCHGEWARTSLVWLHEHGKLNGPQSQRLGSLLWDGLDSSGVPKIACRYSFRCMGLPHPAEIDPEPRVKEHLRSALLTGLASGHPNQILEEMCLAASVVNWSVADAIELTGMFSKWWDENEPRLHSHLPTPFGSPSERTKQTIWSMVSALSEILGRLPADEDGELLYEKVRGFISDLADQGLPVTRLEVALSASAGREQLIDRVAAGLADRGRDRTLDALLAARLLAMALVEQDAQGAFGQVGTMLAQGVEWRHRPALVDRLGVVAELVRDHPWFVTAGIELSLLRGLAEIAEETSGGVKGNDEDGVILIRASASALAFELFQQNRKWGKDGTETMLRWQTICRDPNEFAEVRNAWMPWDPQRPKFEF